MRNPNITETVLIFGRSAFIKDVDISKLKNLGYTTFGINNQNFETDYVAFVDEGMALAHKELKGTLITQPRYLVREPVIYYNEWNYELYPRLYS